MKTIETRKVEIEAGEGDRLIFIVMECDGDGVPQSVHATLPDGQKLRATAETFARIAHIIQNSNYRHVCSDHGYFDPPQGVYECPTCKPVQAVEVV